VIFSPFAKELIQLQRYFQVRASAGSGKHLPQQGFAFDRNGNGITQYGEKII